MFPPWTPFFCVLTADGITAARNKFRSATTSASEAVRYGRELGAAGS